MSHLSILAVEGDYSVLFLMGHDVLIYHHHHLCLDQLLSPLHLLVIVVVKVCNRNYHSIITYMQVSSNGLVSFGTSFTSYMPRTFPISVNVVAPYWDDTDTTMKGGVRFDVITPSHPTLACLLEQINGIINKENEYQNFKSSWLLVARWINVCPYLNSNCFEVRD